MADNTINVKIREAYDTETNWNQKNPVLLQGQIAISSDKHGMYKVGDGTKTWQQLDYASHPASDVYSWAKAQTKPSYTKSEVGLGNVDNTSDANKPISTATQAALDAKQATITGAATTITGSNLTASRALVSNSSGKVAVSAVTSTELGYLDGVTSAIQTQLNVKVAKNDTLLTTNPFAPSSLIGPYISKIDNAFYCADKRWTVTATNTSGVSKLFDGDYEGAMNIASGNTSVITMDFSSEPSGYFPGYPYGYIYISFYYTSIPKSVTGRVYCNYSSHGIGWHDISFSLVPGSGNSHVTYVGRQGVYNISKLEITIVARDSGNTAVTEMEMKLDRPYSGRTPFLSKYQAETLYYDLTAPKFIGALNGNADTATNASKVNNHTVNADVPSGAKFTDTTYTFATGDANGQIKVTPLGGSAQNVSVKGLGTLAYKDSLTKSDVGLGNVDNTSDANKPISTATQSALDGKQATITGAATTITSSNLTGSKALISNASGKVAVSNVSSTELGYLSGVTSAIQTQLNGKQASIGYTPVNKAGDTMTGTLTVPVIQTGTADTSYFQTRKFRGQGNAGSYQHAIDFGYAGHNQFDFYEYGGVFNFHKHTDTAIDAGDTLIGTINSNGWNGGAVLTGTPTAPTATAGTNTTQIATTAFVKTAVDNIINGAPEAYDTLVEISNYISSHNSEYEALLAITNDKQDKITGGATTITQSNLTASRALVSDSNGKVAVSAVTSTELGYLDGVTSAIQTQIDGKQASITGAATTIAQSNLTASRALVSNSSGKVAVSAVTSTELGYLDGVTSAIQTQLNAKAPLASPALTGTPTAPTADTGTNTTQIATTEFVNDQINAIDLGGRNLVLNSDDEKTSQNSIIEYSISDYGKELAVGDTITVSFDVKADNVTNTKFDVYLRGSSNIRSNPAPVISNLSTSYERRWFTAKVTGAFTTLAFRTTSAGSNGNTSATLTFRRIKVEAGQVPTDWTLAPEDVSPVSVGGTGASSFTSGALLIGNGTNAIGTRAIKNMTTKGDLGWTAAATDIYIPTINTLAYWNGRYNSASSNLAYCVKGAFGNLAVKDSLTASDVGAEPEITGAATTITSSNLTASRALVSDSSGKVAVSAVTSTELGYLDGVTSAIQTQLNGKQAQITGGASTITSDNLTASRALTSNASGKVVVSAVTATELGYLDGVTQAIQTQLNGKQASLGFTPVNKAGDTMTGSLTITRSASGNTGITAERTDSGMSSLFIGVGSGGVNHGIYSNTLGKWIAYADASKVYLNGNAATATTSDALKNFRTSTTTNLGIDTTTAGGAVGYVNGLTSATWNYNQTNGALYSHTYNSNFEHQIYGDYRTGQISIRGKSSGTWQDWRRILDESNYSSIITKSGLGLGNVEDKSSATIRGEITSSNVTTALGYTPSKAQDIANAIDDLEVGGRNLLKDSHKAVSNGSYAMVDYYFGDRPPLNDEIVTLQVKGTLASTKTSWQPYNSGGSISAPALKLTSQNYDSTTGIYTATGQWKVGSASNTYLRIYSMTSSQSGTSSIEWVKLERGDKATDWTLAPEDVITGLSISGKTITYSNQTGQLGTLTTQDTVALEQMSGTLAISQGGTGATTALAATKALGVFSNKTGSDSGDNIPNNADLNDYTTPGVYISTSSTVSKTLDHTPTTTSGFKLFVDGSYHSNYIRQFAFTAGTYFLTHRVRKANGTWTEWAHTYDTVNKPSKSDVGLGNVDNKSSETIRGEITSQNVTTALGYTPVNKTGDTMSGALTLSSGNITAETGHLYAGKTGLEAETQVHAFSKSGDIYLYSTGNSSGNGARGLYVPAHGTGGAKNIIVVDTNNNVTFSGSLSGAASSNVLKTGDTMSGQLTLKPASGEGGQICLDASTAQTTQGGIYLDQFNSAFRIFGKPSSDGSTGAGAGTILTYEPYNSGKLAIGNARVITSAMFSLNGTTLTITIPDN